MPSRPGTRLQVQTACAGQVVSVGLHGQSGRGEHLVVVGPAPTNMWVSHIRTHSHACKGRATEQCVQAGRTMWVSADRWLCRDCDWQGTRLPPACPLECGNHFSERAWSSLLATEGLPALKQHRTRSEPVPDSDCTVAFRFSRSTPLLSPNANRTESRQNCVPFNAMSACHQAFTV